MRSLTFAAAMLIVGIAAISADASKVPDQLGHREQALKTTKSIERLVKLHKAGYFLMDKKAKSKFDLNKLDTHKFNPQQDLTAISSASPACQAAYANIFTNHLACFTGTNPLSTIFGGDGPKTATEAAATWEDFRTGSCYSAWTVEYRAMVEACRSDFGSKAANEALIVPVMLTHFAEGTGTDGTKCGVTFNHAINWGWCDRANSTLCSGKLAETCQVVDKKVSDLVEADQYSWQYNAGGTSAPRNITCEAKWSSATALGGMCNGCFGNFVRQYRDLAKDNEILDQFAIYERLLCSKNTVGGGYCLNDMAEFGTSNMLTETQIDGICADRGVLGCYLGMLSTTIATNKKTLISTFQSCIRTYDYTTNTYSINVTAADLASGGSKNYCYRTYKSQMEDLKEAKVMSRYLCMENGAGNNCIVARQGLFTNTDGCYRAAHQHDKWLSAGSWTSARNGLYNCSNCSTVLQTAVDNMGCCAGLVQEAVTEVLHFGPNDWPSIANIPTAAQVNVTAYGSQNCTVPSTIPDGSEATTMSGSGAIKVTERCGVTGLDTTLCTKCQKSQKTVKKELKLKISWAKLQDDEALKERVKLGLRTDMADNLGISIEDIVNDEIAEDPTVSVTITSTTTTAPARRQTSTSQSTGAKYSFELSGQTDDQVEAASENFDSMESQGTLEIQSTEAATTDCGCVGDGQLAVAETEASGAATATAVLGALIAALCLLF